MGFLTKQTPSMNYKHNLLFTKNVRNTDYFDVLMRKSLYIKCCPMLCPDVQYTYIFMYPVEGNYTVLQLIKEYNDIKQSTEQKIMTSKAIKFYHKK